MPASAVIPAVTAMADDTIIDATAVDYLIMALYFVVVLGIGVLARRQVGIERRFGHDLAVGRDLIRRRQQRQ